MPNQSFKVGMMNRLKKKEKNVKNGGMNKKKLFKILLAAKFSYD